MWGATFGITIFLLLILWAVISTKGKEEQEYIHRLNNADKELRKLKNKAWDDHTEFIAQQKKDLESAIKYSLSHCRTQQDKKELLEIITDNLWYVGEINNVTDFFKYDIKYVIKVCTYAKEGRLDYYQKSDENEDKLYRLDKDGQYVVLTDVELEKLKNKNYDFIFE